MIKTLSLHQLGLGSRLVNLAFKLTHRVVNAGPLSGTMGGRERVQVGQLERGEPGPNSSELIR
jgi:hypothetical protein